MRSPGEVIGRTATADALARALAAGAGAFVTGPPGVGVTHLLRSASDLERSRGRQVRYRVGSLGPDGPPADLAVIDDVHLLDEAAGERLREAVLNDGLRLLAGTSSPDRCAPAVSWLWTAGVLARVDVEPLRRGDVADLVEAAVGCAPDGRTVEALLADSAGLPALLVPVLEAAGATGALRAYTGCARLSGPLPTSPSLAARVRALRERCTPAATAALEVLCVGGSVVVPHPALDGDGVDELLRLSLVSAHDGDGAAVVRPAAGAVARVVRDELGPVRRAAIAARLLEAPGASPPASVLRWRLLAGRDDVDDAEILVAAGEHRRRGDLDEAEGLARRVATTPPGALLLAEVLADLGRRREAASVLEGVLGSGDGAGGTGIDGLDRVLCTFEYATLMLWNLGEGARALALADELAAMPVPDAASPRLRAAAASLHAYAGRPAAALGLLGPLADAPDSYDDHLVDHVVAVCRALTGSCAAAVTDAGRGLDRCIAVTDGVPGPDPEIHVLSNTLAMVEAGHLAPAAALAAEWYERALARRLHVGWLALARARVALAAGDLGAATRFGREATADFADLDNHAPWRLALAAQVLAASARADAAAAASHLAELDALGPTAVRFLEPDVERARAWATAATGNVSGAATHLVHVGQAACDEGSVSLGLVALHDAVRLGSRQGAAAVVEVAGDVDGPFAEARVTHARSFTAGQPDGLLAAAIAFGGLGAHLCAADAAAQAALILRRRGDRPGARAATAVVDEHRARCGPAATPALRAVGVAQLSNREQEVARLAASGLASKAVAAQLGISVRTVENLLQRCYAKLGVHGRGDLASALDRQAV